MIDPQRFEALVAFIVERMRVWHKKEVLGQPWPWTDDRILRLVYVNNVYRELDRLSRFEARLVAGQPAAEALRRVLHVRHTLAEPSARLAIDGADLPAFEALHQARPGDLVGHALRYHSRSGLGRPATVWATARHIDQVAPDLAQALAGAQTGAEVVKKVVTAKLWNFGEFRAYEVFTSLAFHRWFSLTEDDLVHIGQGAAFGLAYLDDTVWLPVDQPSQLQRQHRRGLSERLAGPFMVLKRALAERLAGHPGFICPYPTFRWTNRTTEDSLCEFRKYLDAAAGRFRRVYRPRAT